MGALVFAGVRIRESLRPLYFQSFTGGGSGELRRAGWHSYGGTWEVRDGVVRNISDDRGARLVNGSRFWRNYIIESDIQLLGDFGDAGFLIRTSDEETGVDSYHGYFAGLRNIDETLTMGRADYGWREFQTVPVRAGILPRHWYHLKVLAYGCTVAAVSTTESGEIRTGRIEEPDCLKQGHFGLQSYAVGAAWKDLTVRPATSRDLDEILAVKNRNATSSATVSADSVDPWTERRFDAPMQRSIREHRSDPNTTSIASLQILPLNRTSQVTVHGVVTMVSPQIYAQDGTGGIAISGAGDAIPIGIGDTIEARGTVEPGASSAVMKNAEVRVLWTHTPVLPVSVTASEAASGNFDAQFVETEGRLVSIDRSKAQTVVLRLDHGDQPFVAVADQSELAGAARDLRMGSRLLIRGICVSDPKFVRQGIPFALLMRSKEDARVVEAPPWWNGEHLIEAFVALLLFSMEAQMAIYSLRRTRFRAAMEERERLAMEMHDTLAQSFAGLGYQLEGICGEISDDTALRAKMVRSIEMVRRGHEEARRNIAALRPNNVEQVGLMQALEQASRSIVRGGSIAVRTEAKGEPVPVPLEIADALLRISQESLSNAILHGHPQSIQIRVFFGKSAVRLVVRDDGQGFSQDRQDGGLGLRGMARRAENVGAVLRVYSAPGKGTIVSVRARLSRVPAWFQWTAAAKEKWRQWIHAKTIERAKRNSPHC